MSTFNIRVYGLLINELKEVLITDEFRFGKEMTKFPGGGLNWGEGTIECIKRECREEMDCEIEVVEHFYTTDYFQPAAFYDNHQLISIYYIIKNIFPLTIPISKNKNDLSRVEGSQSFRWISIPHLSEAEFTFPIDKKVVSMLHSYHKT